MTVMLMAVNHTNRGGFFIMKKSKFEIQDDAPGTRKKPTRQNKPEPKEAIQLITAGGECKTRICVFRIWNDGATEGWVNVGIFHGWGLVSYTKNDVTVPLTVGIIEGDGGFVHTVIPKNIRFIMDEPSKQGTNYDDSEIPF